MSEYTKPKAGEHVIGYAYPTSTNATFLGKGKTGCFVVHVVGNMTAHPNYADCVALVKTLGTRPGRWSIDHPWNHRFYPEHEAIPEVQAWHLMLAAEEAQRAAAAERTRAVVAAGGRVSLDMDRMPTRTVVTETHRDAAGHGVAVRNAGELWGDL